MFYSLFHCNLKIFNEPKELPVEPSQSSESNKRMKSMLQIDMKNCTAIVIASKCLIPPTRKSTQAFSTLCHLHIAPMLSIHFQLEHLLLPFAYRKAVQTSVSFIPFPHVKPQCIFGHHKVDPWGNVSLFYRLAFLKLSKNIPLNFIKKRGGESNPWDLYSWKKNSGAYWYLISLCSPQNSI